MRGVQTEIELTISKLQVITGKKFREKHTFSNNIFIILGDNLLFVYNKINKALIEYETQLFAVYIIAENGVIVHNNNCNKYGLLNSAGEFKIECQYDYLDYYRGSYLKATIGKKESILDLNGKVIVPSEFDDIKHLNGDKFIVRVEKKGYGIYDTKEQKIITKRYYDYIYKNRNVILTVVGTLKGILEKDGNEILKPIYTMIDIGCGIIKRDDKTGLVNKKGEIVIDLTDCMNFEPQNEELCLIESDKGQYLIDREGTKLTDYYDLVEIKSNNKYYAVKNGVEKIIQVGN